MPTTRTLKDYAGFLRAVAESGSEFVVIGGCAVGAYAALQGETIVSEDLDLLMAPAEISSLVDWIAGQPGVSVVKRPQPRSLGVAVLEWNGLEVNILGRSDGFDSIAAVLLGARQFGVDGVDVPVADPADLLANKLAVARPKDAPHVVVLRKFVEAEVVDDFETLHDPRARIHGARRFLHAIGDSTLPDSLVDDLLPRLRKASDVRFLINHSTTGRREPIRAAAKAAGLWDASLDKQWAALAAAG